MDYQTISTMKVVELKTFLRLRGLKVTGKKVELVARAYSAIENNVQVLQTAEEVETQIDNEYRNKLYINDNYTIPDPFKVTEGWKNEADGMHSWPMITAFNVIKFLMIGSEVEDLNDYKSSKAFSYYKQGWLGELMFLPSAGNTYCVLKTDCRPSQRISDTKHKLWLLLTSPSGCVVRAHCTCMAGVGSTCNHVAAALFRMEAAGRLGLLNPSCTNKPCEWLPNRKDVQPCKVKAMDLNRDDFRKRNKRVKKINNTPKRQYDPIETAKAAGVKELDFNDIVNIIGDLVESTTLATALPKPKIDFIREIISQKPVLDETVLSIDDITLLSSSKGKFFENLKDITKNITKIENITRGQSSNELWFEYRKGVITASKVHEVKTKMTKLKSNCASEPNLWSLIQKILGLTFVSPSIPALKYGREMEKLAAEKLVEILKLSHKDVLFSDCGLYLHKEHPFIGASPDGIITCSCHGKFCVEIKCPYSISHLSPTDESAKLLYIENGNLKHSHQYYSQCQQQMGIIGADKCLFFVFTAHGYLLNEINFDKSFFDKMFELCIEFYKDHYLKAIYK